MHSLQGRQQTEFEINGVLAMQAVLPTQQANKRWKSCEVREIPLDAHLVPVDRHTERRS